MRKLFLGLFFGLLTQAALAQTPGSLPGCQYNATPPTLSDKQTTVWQCDSSGKLITSSTANPNTVIGPGATVTNGAAVVWDGTSGTLVKDSKIVLTVPAATTTLTLVSGTTITGPSATSTLPGLSLANIFTGLQTTQGLTTTTPGWFVQLTGDANPRAAVRLNSADGGSVALGAGGVSALDTFFGRSGAAAFRLGAPDAAAPVAQTLGVQGVVAGTTNTAGANLTIAGSVSTGSAAGGSIIFQTAIAGGAGSGQNALSTRLSILAADQITLTGIGGTVSYLGTYNSINDSTNLYALVGINGSFTGGIGIGAASALYFTSGNALGTADTILRRDAANTLALRNSTTGQRMVFYNTYTDASNNEFFMVDWQSVGGRLKLATIGNGTGSPRQIWIGPNGSAVLSLATNNTERWQIDTSGHFIAGTDNTYDIGALGATRPRNVYVAGNVTAGGGSFNGTLSAGTSISLGAANGIVFNGRSILWSPVDGQVMLTNQAATDFTRLQFGGTTSSFPAIARNGIKLEAKLADDSTYASVAMRGVIVAGAVPTLALAGGTCAGTVIAGGSTAGTVTLTGVCVATNTMALTVMPTAPTGYACDAIDRTLGSSLLTETATTATSVTFTFGGTTGATDVLAYKCLAY